MIRYIQKKFCYVYLICFFVFFLSNFAVNAQVNGIGRYWFFEGKIGFDFSSGAPVLLTNGALVGSEGSTTATDENGNLLFYGGPDATGSGSAELYNRNHLPMLNSSGIQPLSNPKQGPETVRMPGTTDKYYFIAPSVGGSPADQHLYYSVIDMTLALGLGGVDPANKNIAVSSNVVTEAVIVIEKTNSCEFWLISHNYNTDQFNVDEITASGIVLGTQQAIGPSNVRNNGGYMAYSAVTQKLAMIPGNGSVTVASTITLFDFNPATGILSNYVNITLPFLAAAAEYYSCAFSPDGTKLYVGGGYGQNVLLQVDLSNSNAITTISNGGGGDAIRLGPDNKIYVRKLYASWIGVVNNPDLPGISCNYNPIFMDCGQVSFSDGGFPATLHASTSCLIELGSDTILCEGQSMMLDAGSDYSSYTWSSSAGTITNTTSSIFVSPTVTTTYYVSSPENSCCIDSVTVTVVSSLSPTAGSDQTICNGASITLVSSGGGIDYSWSPYNTLSSPTGSTVVASPSVTTTYSMYATNGICSGTGEITIHVHATPVAVSASGDISVCTGTTTVQTAAAVGGDGVFSYTWMPGSYSGNSMSVALFSSTTFSVIATDGCGTTGLGLVNVFVYPIPTFDFTVDTTMGCAPLCVSFTVNPVFQNASCLWHWGSPDTTSSNSCNLVQHCYNVPGDYSPELKITDSNGCGDSLLKMNMIQVYEKVTADFVMDAQEIIVSNATIHFIDSSSGATIWNWMFDDSNGSTSYLQNPIFTYSEAGVYHVLLKTSNLGCSDSIYKTVIILEEYNTFIPAAFSPNGDGLNDVFLPKGIDSDVSEYQMIVFNRWGNIVFQTTDWSEGWNGKVQRNNVDALEEVYMYRITTKDQYNISHNYMGHINLIR